MSSSVDSGGRNVNSISQKAKAFNQELQLLQAKLHSMQDISYDKSKLDLIFSTTEKALEQRSHLEIVNERMRVIE